VDQSPLNPHLATPAELKARLDAERHGKPFLLYRHEQEGQRIVELHAGAATTIGRDDDCDAQIGWDERVSGLHAEVSSIGSHWVVVDDGLSRNGTYLNGERVAGRRRLNDGDELRVGDTILVFREPGRNERKTTAVADAESARPELTPAQLRVLVALCRPLHDGDRWSTPATNQQIADELVLTVAAVKTHLRILFQRFGLGEVPHNEKRARLARLAFELGFVTPANLARD
jgi:pSer/pThr/pTyr-binding forkhead associated (FHA) protein